MMVMRNLRMFSTVHSIGVFKMINRLKKLLILFALGSFLSVAVHGEDSAPPDFFALCYHDVVDAPRDNSEKLKAQTVSTDTLIRHFNWLQEHGYQPVSYQQIVDAQNRREPLPEKAVLLTFDDGYRSFYTHVLPLLKLYRFPAVLAVVGKWLEAGEGDMVVYGDKERIPRSEFVTWQQLREIQSSGLVEIASHSHDLHQGVIGNPYWNLQPAGITRVYSSESSSYEADEHYQKRILADLRGNQAVLKKQLGQAPRIMVWPYGAYSGESMELARQAGLTVNFTLDGVGHNRLSQLGQIDRLLMKEEIKDVDLWRYLNPQQKQPPVRVAHVDLDYLYDRDRAQQKRNLDKLLDRIKALRINTVYLQAFADPDGDGSADALYFPNRHLPVRGDLFNRVAWQLMTRSEVKVYAWMPVLSFTGLKRDAAYVENSDKTGQPSQEGGYVRLSPFDPRSRQIVKEIYADLAKHAHFDGILFHDDAYLTDREDMSMSALDYYRREWQMSGSVDDILADTVAANRWSRHKTLGLIGFTHELADLVRFYRGNEILTARNIYARTILEPESETWLAQSFQDFIDAYDYVAVMAMPYLEGESKRPGRWLRELAKAVVAQTEQVDKVVFELQSVDWRTGKRLGNRLLRKHFDIVNRAGIHSFGYYPDDFIADYPSVDAIRPVLSLSRHPYIRR